MNENIYLFISISKSTQDQTLHSFMECCKFLHYLTSTLGKQTKQPERNCELSNLAYLHLYLAGGT